MVKELGGDRVKSKLVGEGNECQSARNYKVLSNILSKKKSFFYLSVLHFHANIVLDFGTM